MVADKGFEPRILAFACENSGCLAAEQAAKMQFSYPENIHLIKVPCSGRIDVLFFLRALEKADGVMVLACQKENCKFIRGNTRAAQRVKQTQRLLAEIGLEKERVSMFYLAANMGNKFSEITQDYFKLLKHLGPNPGKVIK